MAILGTIRWTNLAILGTIRWTNLVWNANDSSAFEEDDDNDHDDLTNYHDDHSKMDTRKVVGAEYQKTQQDHGTNRRYDK